MADAADDADERFKEDQSHFDVDGWAERAQADLAEAQRLFAAAAADEDAEDDEDAEEDAEEDVFSQSTSREPDPESTRAPMGEPEPEPAGEPEPEPEPAVPAREDDPPSSAPKKPGRFSAMLDVEAVEADWSNRGGAGSREPRTANAPDASAAASAASADDEPPRRNPPRSSKSLRGGKRHPRKRPG